MKCRPTASLGVLFSLCLPLVALCDVYNVSFYCTQYTDLMDGTAYTSGAAPLSYEGTSWTDLGTAKTTYYDLTNSMGNSSSLSLKVDGDPPTLGAWVTDIDSPSNTDVLHGNYLFVAESNSLYLTVGGMDTDNLYDIYIITRDSVLTIGSEVKTNSTSPATTTTDYSVEGHFWTKFTGISGTTSITVVADSGTDEWPEVAGLQILETARETLQVASEHGTPSPAVGTYTNLYGTALTNAVASPVTLGTTQYVCTGWAMTGNEPLTGNTNWMTMTHTNDAVLTWQWKTQYWVETTVDGVGGSVTGAWGDAGSNVTIVATPDYLYELTAWSGDTNGATFGTNSITLPADGPRQVSATFAVPLDRTGVFNVNFYHTTFATDMMAGTGYSPGVSPAEYDGDTWNEFQQSKTTYSNLLDSSGASSPVWFEVDSDDPILGTWYADNDEPDDDRIAGNHVFADSSYFISLTFGGLDSNLVYDVYIIGRDLTLTHDTTVKTNGTAWVPNYSVEGEYWNRFTGITGATQVTVVAEQGTDSETGISGLQLAVRPRRFSLQIVSDHGTPLPGVGTHTNLYGAALTNAVASPVTLGTTQYVCTGWAMTGNGPVSGTTNWMTMTHTNDAVLSWQWGTNYWVDVSATGSGSVGIASGWYPAGANAEVIANPSAGSHFAYWAGTVGGDSNPISLIVSDVSAITATFKRDPMFSGMGLTGSVVALDLYVPDPPETYAVERCFSLPTTNWHTVTNLVISTTYTNWSVPATNTWQRAFYRLRLE